MHNSQASLAQAISDIDKARLLSQSTRTTFDALDQSGMRTAYEGYSDSSGETRMPCTYSSLPTEMITFALQIWIVDFRSQTTLAQYYQPLVRMRCEDNNSFVPSQDPGTNSISFGIQNPELNQLDHIRRSLSEFQNVFWLECQYYWNGGASCNSALGIVCSGR